MPRGAARGVRPRSGRARAALPGAPSATAPTSSATTTSATRSSSSPTSPATRSSSPSRPRPNPAARVHRVLRRALHGRERGHPDLRRPAGDPAGPGRGLLDGRHGRDRPGRGRLGPVRASSGWTPTTIPVTYMNSTAAIKAFTGRNGGTICTSSNARQSLEWAFAQGERVFFLPDQHLGRNTAVLELGLSLDDCVLFDPHKPGGGLTDEQLRDAKVVLWRGHCSVHGRFTEDGRRRGPASGSPASTSWCTPSAGTRWFARRTTSAAPSTSSDGSDAAEPGSSWAIGTELNLVRRLAHAHPDKQVTLPGPLGLLLLDDEPDRPAAPGLGAGEPGRRQRGQPHRRGPATRSTGPGLRWTACWRCPASGPRSCRTRASPPRDRGAGATAPGGATRLEDAPNRVCFPFVDLLREHRKRNAEREATRTRGSGSEPQSPGAPQIGNQRARSFSTTRSSRTRSRTCSSSIVSRLWALPASGANG